MSDPPDDAGADPGAPPEGRWWLNPALARLAFGATTHGLSQSAPVSIAEAMAHALAQGERLDLDLIAFGQEVRSSSTLVLPHPRAHLRQFVLAPLAEIAPEFILPGQDLPLRALLGRTSSDGVERIIL